MPPLPTPIAAALATLGGVLEGEVRTDDVSRALYATDASLYEVLPVGVAFPRSVDDLCRIARAATEAGLPVTPRGAGTSLSGRA